MAPELHKDCEGPEKVSSDYTILNKIFFMKYALKSVLALVMLECPMGLAPELHPDAWRGQEKVSNA